MESTFDKLRMGEDMMKFSEIILPLVQMEPPILNQTKNRDSYSLHWETQKIPKYIDHTFQVQYKKKSASWEVSSRTQGMLQAGRRGKRGNSREPYLPGADPSALGPTWSTGDSLIS